MVHPDRSTHRAGLAEVFHRLLLEGVFFADGDTVRWVRVPPPTTEEVQQLVTHIAR